MASAFKRSLLILFASILLIEAALHGIAWMIRDDTNHFSKLAGTDKIRILCIGDSNTYGLYLEKHQAWPAQLQNILDKRQPGKFQVINLGYPGTPTYRIAESIASWINELQPDMVIVLAGVNDIFYGAIPAKNISAGSTFSLHGFLTRYSRLYKFWRLFLANAFPVNITNDADIIMDILRELKDTPDDELEEKVARIYQIYLALDDAPVNQDAEGFWIGFGANKQRILPIARKLQDEPLLFEQLKILITSLNGLGVSWEKLTTSGKIRIGDNDYDLNLIRDEPKPGNSRGVIATNLILINKQLKETKIRALFLTYASNDDFYREANQATRLAARSGNIPLLDVQEQFSKQCKAGACDTWFFPDQHPNEAGYRIMAEIIADAISPTSSAL